ncbi:hypothetical protein E4U28_004993 [Claviceps purpurea]|nr:hypothetical protein E4U28_004993 [Claviceps purpurea]
MIEAVMILAPSSKALLLKAIIALAAKHSAGSEGDASGSTGKQRVLLGGYNVNNVRSMAVAAVHGNAVRHRVVVAVEVVTDEIRTRDTPFKNSRCPAQGKLYIVSFDNLAALGHADDLNVPDPFFRDEYDRPHLLNSRHGSNLLGSFPRAFHVVKLDRNASEDLGVAPPMCSRTAAWSCNPEEKGGARAIPDRKDVLHTPTPTRKGANQVKTSTSNTNPVKAYYEDMARKH